MSIREKTAHHQLRPLALAVGLAVAANAAAESTSADTTIEEVYVFAHPLAANGVAQPVEVLNGDLLTRNLSTNIGETVGRLPGVNSASFGPAAGRPVIHGLGGPRVRVMEDRIDSLDASVTSADHQVAIEGFVAERVEVLKGPSTLLYGTGAVGGVVDIQTSRIPSERPEEPLTGRAELRGADNADLFQGAFRVDGGSGGFAFHADGFYRDADEYDIDGFTESAPLRAQEEAEEAEEFTGSPGLEEEEEEEVRGTAPGTQMEQQGGALGLSWVGERGFIGGSVSFLEAEYGLPGGKKEEEGEEEEEEEEEEGEGNPILDLEQVRVDLEAGLDNPLPGFSSLNVRLAFNDYEHVEFEPNGEAGTKFSNEAWELRTELGHEPLAGFTGVLGLQLQFRDFSAIGEEAFVPPVETERYGLFWVGERDLGAGQLELGARIEQVDHDPTGNDSTDFFAWAASLGWNVNLDDGWRVALLADVARRAPVAEELYSDGPHLATRSFERGDPNLNEEGVTGLSATLERRGERAGMALTVYGNFFSDFIYEVPTGEEEDDLPVLEFRQNDATFTGVDFSSYWRPAVWDQGNLELRAMFDTVEASLDNAGSGNNKLPRIPAQRYGGGLSLTHGGLFAAVDVLRVRAQETTTEFELPTDAYTDVRLDVSYNVPVGEQTLQLFVQGRNLTDEEQRQHASFVKDFIPLPGRTVEAGFRFTF